MKLNFLISKLFKLSIGRISDLHNFYDRLIKTIEIDKFQWFLVQSAGIEPAREFKSRRILSPVRLPVSPRLHIAN